MRCRKLSILFCFSLFLLIGFTLWWGEAPWSEVWKGVIERLSGQSTNWNPLLDERLPRLIVLLCTGASLAVSGACMQSLFHNPLASPSILGISCGGSLFVVIIFVMEWHLIYPFAIPMAAFWGCLITLLVVYAIASWNQEFQLTHFILTGIAISTLLLAIQGAITYALRDRWHLMQTVAEWEAGSTTDKTWKHVHMQLPLTLVGLFGAIRYRRELDILALGNEEALSLGVEVDKVRWRLFLSVALLTGGSIAACGIIAFFGLVLPHIIRKIYGPSNQLLLPLCVISGSLSLVGMDLTLRILNIHSFSIGNVSAIIGGVFFILLLFHTKKRNMMEYSC